MGNTAKRSQFLGMNWSSAQLRLRKMILFSLLEKHGENICYNCGEQIGDLDDLSIEHKQPWEDRDVALFWDLENIAFSHTKCNRPHKYRNGFSHYQEQAPNGQQWCSGCKNYQDDASFASDPTKRTGRDTTCKRCRNEWKRTRQSRVT